VFQSAPMTPAGFRKTLARISEASVLAFPVHPPMLRHACGLKLANDGQDTRALQHYLGHRNIQHTATRSPFGDLRRAPIPTPRSSPLCGRTPTQPCLLG
jgi:integrase